jgi:hypothetical protein
MMRQFLQKAKERFGVNEMIQNVEPELGAVMSVIVVVVSGAFL